MEGISRIITFETLKKVFLFVFFSSRILYGLTFNILSKVSRKINKRIQWCQKLMKNINNHKINMKLTDYK